VALQPCHPLGLACDKNMSWKVHLLYSRNICYSLIHYIYLLLLYRYWLIPLCHIDPDVSFFGKENHLSEEDKALLHDLGRITNFKAVSDVPAFWSQTDRSEMRAFILNNDDDDGGSGVTKEQPAGKSGVVVTRKSYSSFVINDREVSFAKAIPIPVSPVPRWLWLILRWLLHILLKQHWVMRFFSQLDDNKYAARRKRVRAAYNLH
jgi:hypothetical protein